MVQPDQGLRLDPTARWRREGRFCSHSAVEKAGLFTLNEGQVIEYEEVSNRGKNSAENLKVQR